MNYSPETRSILEELERRKAAKDDPCESCDGTGCAHCLGQGVLLTAEEYAVLMEIAVKQPDDILDAEIIQ